MIWQTRTLATFVAATVPVDNPGESSPLLEQAQAIGEAPSDKNDNADEGNPNGSFERFMGSFGTPARWAGR